MNVKEKMMPNLKISRKGVEHMNSLLLHFMHKMGNDCRHLHKIENRVYANGNDVVSSLKLLDFNNPVIKNILNN